MKMMNLKRTLFTGLLTVSMIAAVTGCGKKTEETTAAATEAVTTVAATTEAATTEAPTTAATSTEAPTTQAPSTEETTVEETTVAQGVPDVEIVDPFADGIADGYYNTMLSSDEYDDGFGHLESCEISGSTMTITGSFNFRSDADDSYDDALLSEKTTQTFTLSSKVTYAAAGGDAEPEYMSQDEFIEYLGECDDSGLDLEFSVEGGVVTEISICS